MVWTKHDYDAIPGTYVFDGKHGYGAYNLNKLLYSLCEQSSRDEFTRDPDGFCEKFGVTGKYRELLLGGDFLGLLRAGANIYYMAKLAVPRGVSVQDAGAAFQGVSSQEFQDKLLAKREGLEEKLKARGGYWVG